MIKPQATYYSAIDSILYLTEDVSYRTEPVDDYLEVLWHPQEDRVVGVKVKNALYINKGFIGDKATLYISSFLGYAMGPSHKLLPSTLTPQNFSMMSRYHRILAGQ